MALNLDPEGIAEALRRNVESWTPSVSREEVGRVMETGDGIARVSGLPRAMSNELLEFRGGVLGLAFNLDEDEIGCILLGDASHIEEGDAVTQTGRILSVPVGDGFLGRVVDPLGRPLDGGPPPQAQGTRLLESCAPGIAQRQPGADLCAGPRRCQSPTSSAHSSAPISSIWRRLNGAPSAWPASAGAETFDGMISSGIVAAYLA